MVACLVYGRQACDNAMSGQVRPCQANDRVVGIIGPVIFLSRLVYLIDGFLVIYYPVSWYDFLQLIVCIDCQLFVITLKLRHISSSCFFLRLRLHLFPRLLLILKVGSWQNFRVSCLEIRRVFIWRGVWGCPQCQCEAVKKIWDDDGSVCEAEISWM